MSEQPEITLKNSELAMWTSPLTEVAGLSAAYLVVVGLLVLLMNRHERIELKWVL